MDGYTNGDCMVNLNLMIMRTMLRNVMERTLIVMIMITLLRNVMEKTIGSKTTVSQIQVIYNCFLLFFINLI